MEAQFDRLGLLHRRIEAVDGGTLDLDAIPGYDRRARLSRYGVDLTPPQLGCYLSHLSAIQMIVDEDLPSALILEDDVNLGDDTPEVLAEIAALRKPWEMIRLAGLRARRSRRVHSLGEHHALVRLLNTASGLQGYLVSNAGARKLLPYAARIMHPVDTMVDRYWENGLKIWAVLPYPIVHSGALETQIPHEPDEFRLRAGTGLWVRVKLGKNRDSIGKMIANLGAYIDP